MQRIHVWTATLLLSATAMAGATRAATGQFPLAFRSYPVGVSPTEFVEADVDRDGHADLVIGGGGGIVVLRDRGDGTFAPPSSLPMTATWRSFAVADFDGDGARDIAVLSSDEVFVLRNDGAGTFTQLVPRTAVTEANAIAAGDFDEDGRADLVTANLDRTARTFRGLGDGSFDPPVSYVMSQYWSRDGVTVADLDHDGHLDALVRGLNESLYAPRTDAVGALMGDGHGAFRIVGIGQTQLESGRPLRLVDVNGDGLPDLLNTYYRFAVGVAVKFGDGLGTFPTYFYRNLPSAYSADAGDANDDRVPDLLVGTATGVTVLPGTGAGAFGSAIDLTTGARAVQSAARDLDGDGLHELLVVDANATVAVFPGVRPARVRTRSRVSAIVATSMNHDAFADLVVADADSNSVSVLLGRGDATFDRLAPVPLIARPDAIALGDLDGDGERDLIVAHTAADAVTVLHGLGGGRFDAGTVLAAAHPSAVAIGDMTGDGRADLVVGTDGLVSVWPGRVGGGLGPAVTTTTAAATLALEIRDVNGDGRSDLFRLRDVSPYGLELLLGTGDGSLIPANAWATGDGPAALVVGDWNGDGLADAAVASATSQTVTVLTGIYSSGFRAVTLRATGSPRAIAAGDLDGDGRMDLAVANGSAGTASIFPGTATGFGTRIDYFGIAAHPVATVTGDVDGDGQSDLIVAGGDSSFLAILRSGAGTTTATMLERFDASPVANAVELVWDVGDPSQVASVTIERALDSNGPWRPVAAEPRNDGDAMRALDRDVEPATTYFYRLVMAFVDGGHYVSSAVSVQTRADDAVSGIIALEPNPVRDAPTIRYAIARAGRVRLDVTDVAGRVVATLVDAFESGGGHTATWHASGRTAAGVYFVRLRAPGGSNTVRRFAIVP